MTIKPWEKLAELHIGRRPSANTTAVLGLVAEQPDTPPLHDFFSSFEVTLEPNEEGWMLAEAAGVRESARAELFFLRRKAKDAVTATKMLLASEQATWSTVDAYHACLMCMRVSLGSFGLFQTAISGTQYAFIDLFPEYADTRLSREYRDQAKKYENPIKIISRKDPTISHKTLTTLYKRLVAVNYSQITEEIPVQKVLRKVDPQKYHPVRNKMIYNGGFMPNIDVRLLPEKGNSDWLDDDLRDLSLVSNLLETKQVSDIFAG